MSYKVIDISKHQGSINFDEVKKENLYGIILRCGYTGYGSSKSKQKDEKFEEYYKECERLKIPVGVYWYSCASSVNEAKEEAKLCLEYIKDKKIQLPVFFDTEDEHHQRELSKSVLSNIVKTDNGPRLHDLRHTFIVHLIEKFINEGLDLNVMLPIIQTHTGHQSLNSLTYYFQVTNDLLNIVNKISEEKLGYLIPNMENIHE